MGCICVWKFAWHGRAEGGRGLIASSPPSLGSALLCSPSLLAPSPSPHPSFPSFFPPPSHPLCLSIAYLLGFFCLCFSQGLTLPPSLTSIHPTIPASLRVGPPPAQEEQRLERYIDCLTTKVRPLRGELSLGQRGWEWGMGLSF